MPDFILRSSPASPFGRKVKLALAVTGLSDRVRIEFADTGNPDDSLRRQNPLGKIPALILADGMVLYDSRVIVDYIDDLAGGGRLIPRDPATRYAALTLQATGDGIMDAAILRRYEIAWREDALRSARWDDHQAGKIGRALDHLETKLPSPEGLLVGELAVASALGYLDFRFSPDWRDGRPALSGWFADFAGRCPGFAETMPR